MKKWISIVLAALLVLSLSACGTPAKKDQSSDPVSAPEKLDVSCNVYGINGPTGMGLVSLMQKAEDQKANLNYNIQMLSSNDEIVAKIVNGEADIAAVATNLASVLYKKTNGGISVLAVNTLGVLCLVTKGTEISSIADLKGKTVLTTGKGANPEYIAKYILEKNGLTVGTDVTLEFVAQPSELVTAVATHDEAIVIAPQPVATTITVKNTAAKIALDLNQEWGKISDTDLVMGCMIARKEYLEQNPEAVKAFMKEYKESVEAVNSNPESAAALCEKYAVVSPAAVAKKALPYCNIVYQDGKKMKTNLSAYLQFLFQANPAAVGGALPQNDFYYEAK